MTAPSWRALLSLERQVADLRGEVAQLRREAFADSDMTDQLAEVLELRVTALEEIAAARWPRSVAVRRRLARDLRESVRGYRWAGDDFASRRIQAIGDGWLRPLSAAGRHRNRGADPGGWERPR